MPTRGTGLTKLSRQSDQRAALMRGLARSLFIHGEITTTRTKAKALRPYAEKLATRAKSATLNDRRELMSAIDDHEAVDALIERMQGSERPGGYLRITTGVTRRGDNAEMASISFVDEVKKRVTRKPEAKAPKAKNEEAPKETTTDEEAS